MMLEWQCLLLLISFLRGSCQAPFPRQVPNDSGGGEVESMDCPGGGSGCRGEWVTSPLDGSVLPSLASGLSSNEVSHTAIPSTTGTLAPHHSGPAKSPLRSPVNFSPSIISVNRTLFNVGEDEQELPRADQVRDGRDFNPSVDIRVAREAGINIKHPQLAKQMSGNKSMSNDIFESLKSLKKKVSTLVVGIQALKTQARSVMNTLDDISEDESTSPPERINPFAVLVEKYMENQEKRPTQTSKPTEHSSSGVQETTSTEPPTEASDVNRLLDVIGRVKPEVYHDDPMMGYDAMEEEPDNNSLLHATDLLTELHRLEKQNTDEPNQNDVQNNYIEDKVHHEEAPSSQAAPEHSAPTNYWTNDGNFTAEGKTKSQGPAVNFAHSQTSTAPSSSTVTSSSTAPTSSTGTSSTTNVSASSSTPATTSSSTPATTSSSTPATTSSSTPATTSSSTPATTSSSTPATTSSSTPATTSSSTPATTSSSTPATTSSSTPATTSSSTPATTSSSTPATTSSSTPATTSATTNAATSSSTFNFISDTVANVMKSSRGDTKKEFEDEVGQDRSRTDNGEKSKSNQDTDTLPTLDIQANTTTEANIKNTYTIHVEADTTTPPPTGTPHSLHFPSYESEPNDDYSYPEMERMYPPGVDDAMIHSLLASFQARHSKGGSKEAIKDVERVRLSNRNSNDQRGAETKLPTDMESSSAATETTTTTMESSSRSKEESLASTQSTSTSTQNTFTTLDSSTSVETRTKMNMGDERTMKDVVIPSQRLEPGARKETPASLHDHTTVLVGLLVAGLALALVVVGATLLYQGRRGRVNIARRRVVIQPRDSYCRSVDDNIDSTCHNCLPKYLIKQ
ncbi:hypothetical protein Pcinc_027541 [Petrolisthes cinctipes]|uniref:Uncharacterized protein n=1 Tax=Petrolisthes cinctipes TaxID=88211 RepID=A0AAE1F3W7_PETCI|nr:hypothetical protein Pcinc_027541 [Petrolisthes cinctipes]